MKCKKCFHDMKRTMDSNNPNNFYYVCPNCNNEIGRMEVKEVIKELTEKVKEEVINEDVTN